MAYTGKKPGNVNTDFLEAGGELANHDELVVSATGEIAQASVTSLATALAGKEPADATILKDADIGTSVLAPNGDGSQLTNLPINQDRTAYRYWKYVCRESILSHHPRVARLVMIDEDGTTTTINTFVSDNCSDSGTIPNSGNAWTHDFGTPTIITRAGGYVTYNGGARGSWIGIYGSTNNSTWVFQGVFPFNAYDCGIVTGEF